MIEASDPFIGLKASRDALEAGLALLDSGAPEGTDQVDTLQPDAWGHVVATLAAAPDPEALRTTVPAARLEEFDGEVEELLRLNAVLVAGVQQERGGLLGKLKTVRETRRGMSFYGAAGPDGDRCDISG